MSISTEEFIKNIEGLTVLELSQLVKGLEDRFGVSAAAMAMPMMAGGGAPAAGAAAEPVEEKTEFTVVLTSVGEKKINVIKVAREVNSSLGLKEAKDLVENIPATVKEGITKDEAETIKKKFAEAGAAVEIK